ncbi:hypothetical protein BGZ76_000849, partial [Entomortierella beljakovae]
LVESATTARVRFSQGSVHDCLRSIQETKKKAEHCEFLLQQPEQERIHGDSRSGSRTDTLPQDYSRHGQPMIQEHGRNPYPYAKQPPLTHRHSNTQSQFQKGSSPGHASFPGPGSGFSHFGQQSQ